MKKPSLALKIYCVLMILNVSGSALKLSHAGNWIRLAYYLILGLACFGTFSGIRASGYALGALLLGYLIYGFCTLPSEFNPLAVTIAVILKLIALVLLGMWLYQPKQQFTKN